MKPRAQILPCLPAAVLLLMAVVPLTLSAAPTNHMARLEIHQSIFAYPSGPAEGRDPFFPTSQRVYGSNSEAKAGPSLSDLTLHTILGTPPRVIALINNHAFAPGDEGDVTTRTGQRMHIRCKAIDPEAGTATVEANGVTDELHLSGDP